MAPAVSNMARFNIAWYLFVLPCCSSLTGTNFVRRVALVDGDIMPIAQSALAFITASLFSFVAAEQF